MKIDDNGTIREMTPEEETKYQIVETDLPITTEDRLRALESAMLEMMGVVTE